MRIASGLLLGSLGCCCLLAQSGPGKPTTPPRAIAVKPAAQTTAKGEARVALVIGNGAYPSSPLKNPVNDARAMASALRDCGFQVELVLNADRTRMFQAVRDFGQKINGGGVGLFYFAGHGMAVRGSNYLIPVASDIAGEDEVEIQGLSVQSVLNKMEAAKNRLNLMVLDACRNNPFGRGFRSGTQGLAQMDAPSGSFIAYATAPGHTASDGGGANGLYTQHLLKALKQPGLKVEEVFKQVRVEVKQDSRDLQVPWDSSSLTGDFYFRPGSAMGVALAQAPAASSVAEAAYAKGMASCFGVGVPKDPQEALIHLMEAADLGHSEAQARLGWLYASGIGTPINDAKAVDYFRLSAEQGNAFGLWGLARAYLGENPANGLEKDEKKALEYMEQSAAQGFWQGLLALGDMYTKGVGTTRDEGRGLLLYRKALAALRPLAEQGDAEACDCLAGMYQVGKGMPQSDSEALAWYRKAAGLGFRRAQWNLSLIYQNGKGVAQSDADALAWLRKSAEQGFVYAQFALAKMYANGKGVAKSDTEAVGWLRKAAEQGYAPAEHSLGWMFDNGKGVTQSDAEATAWYRKAAEQGYSEAQNSLGVHYLNGKGLSQSDAEALHWVRKAADQGHSLAQFNLGWMIENGKGVAQSDAEAATWYRKSADQGNSWGQTNLGLLYYKGKGVPQSDAEAMALYRKAADLGNSTAQRNIGIMYQTGRAVPADPAQARIWYQKAADNGDEAAKKLLTR